jgi:hypothetical protein
MKKHILIVATAALLTITVPGHIIILIIRAPIILLRRPAITLRAMALRQVGTQSPTACNASGLIIRGAERILGQTAVAIHALERYETRTGLAPKTRLAAQIYLRPASWA